MAEEILEDADLSNAMDETIRSTLKEIQSRAPEEVPAETVETAPATEAPKVEKPRDETGKFVKTEKVEPAAPAKQPDKAQIAGATEPAAAEPQEPAPVLTTGQPIDLNRAPSSWKPAAKAVWAGLPEPVRAEIYRRESDFLNGNKGLRENADFGQSVKNVVEPYRMLIEAEGGTPERAIADTLRTAALFRVGTPQQKLAAIFDIDKQFNAGLNQYVQQEFNRLYAQQTGQQPAAQPYQDPRVDQMQQALQAMENERKKQDQERSSREQQASNAAVQRFMSAKDEKGQPLYAFVDNVLDDMSARVQMLRRTNPAVSHEDALKQAYEAAVWANPETRAVLISQQQAQASQPAETLRKVEQAKRASAVNVPKRGALPATEPPKSLDETIRETGKALGMF